MIVIRIVTIVITIISMISQSVIPHAYKSALIAPFWSKSPFQFYTQQCGYKHQLKDIKESKNATSFNEVYAIKEMVHDLACFDELWMHAGGWESTKKA